MGKPNNRRPMISGTNLCAHCDRSMSKEYECEFCGNNSREVAELNFLQRKEKAPKYVSLYPSFSTCKRCKMPWSVVEPHDIDRGDYTGSFSFCKRCWNETEGVQFEGLRSELKIVKNQLEEAKKSAVCESGKPWKELAEERWNHIEIGEGQLSKAKHELKEVIKILEKILPELSIRMSNECKTPDERRDVFFNNELLNECREVINTYNDKEK